MFVDEVEVLVVDDVLEAEDALLDVVEIDDVDVGVALVLVVNVDVVLEDWMMKSRAHLGMRP